MNYTAYNPYAYSQFMAQPPQQGPFMPQPVNNMPGAAQPAMQPQQGQQQPIQGLSGASRPVTSKEEAMGVAADFNGSLMVFPDITHDRVYIKRWNMGAGAAQFQEYAPVMQGQQEGQPRQDAPAGFVSLQDFQNLQDFTNTLQQAVDSLKQEVDSLKHTPDIKFPARTTKKEKQDADA